LLKTVFSTFRLSSTRTNQRTCCGSRPGFRQKSRKLVESLSQTRMNLSKTWLQIWSKTRLAARFAAGYNNGMRPLRSLFRVPAASLEFLFRGMAVNSSYCYIYSLLCVYLLMDTLKPQSYGPLSSNTVIGTLAIDGWAVTFSTARRDLGGLRHRPVPSSLYQM